MHDLTKQKHCRKFIEPVVTLLTLLTTWTKDAKIAP